MKKLMIISMMLILSGCASKPIEDNLVVTTIYPIYDITKIIASDAVGVHNIAPLSMEVHDYEPSAQDIIMLEKASLFIVHGSGMEGWLESTLKNINNDNLEILVLSDGIDLIDDDAHTWMSIQNMKDYSDMIKESLTKVYPDKEKEFKISHDKWNEFADDLLVEFNDLYSNEIKKDLVVDHLAYTYLAHDLNLNQVSITGGTLASDISAKQLRSMVDYIEKEKPKLIYKDEISSEQLFKILNEETGIEWTTLYTLERMNPKEYKSYLDMMEMNLKSVEKGLSYD